MTGSLGIDVDVRTHQSDRLETELVSGVAVAEVCFIMGGLETNSRNAHTDGNGPLALPFATCFRPG